MVEVLFLFFTMALPKAGVQLGSIPLTLNIILFVLVVIRHPLRAIDSVRVVSGRGLCYLLLLGLCMISFAFSVIEGAETLVLAQMCVAVFSPLAAYAVSRVTKQTFYKLVVLCVFIVNVYALLQVAFGLLSIAVPGVTVTFGQSLRSKPVGFDLSAGTVLKYPSTYQNGNLVGIFDVLAFGYLLAARPGKRGWEVARFIALPLSVVGVFLANSRAVLIPFIVAVPFMVYFLVSQVSSRRRGAICAGIAGLVAVLAIIVAVDPQVFLPLQQRAAVTLADPTANGRTTQWNALFVSMNNSSPEDLIHLLLFGRGRGSTIGGEGITGFFAYFGLPGTVVFVFLLVLVIIQCWRKHTLNGKISTLTLVSVVFAYMIDSSFYYLPTLMLFFMFAAAGQDLFAVPPCIKIDGSDTVKSVALPIPNEASRPLAHND